MRFVLGIGTGFDKQGKPISSDAAKIILARVVKEAVSRFGGCFVQPGEGAWVNGAGDVVLEPGVTLTVEVDKRRKPDTARLEAQMLAGFARQAFDQEAVMLTELGSVTSMERV